MNPHRALAALLALAPLPASSASSARVLAAAEAENAPYRDTLKALVGVDAGTVATKGIDYASPTVKGRASHAGGAPEAGRNAVVEIAHQILQLQDVGDKEKGTSLNWTVIRDGTEPNIIPEDAKAEGDMRSFLPSEYDRVLAQARKIAVLTSETPRLYLATRLVMDLSQDDAAK